MSGFDGIGNALRRYGGLVTMSIIVVTLASYVAAWLFKSSFFDVLALTPGSHLQPWNLVSYSIALPGSGNLLLYLLLECYWLWWLGTATEQDVGSGRFLAVFVAAIAAAGAFLAIGGALMPRNGLVVYGPWLPISAITVIWGTRNPTSSVRLFAVIPVSGAVIAWLDVAFTLFLYGEGAPLLGVFAIAHLGLAYLYASNRIPILAYGRGASTRRFLKATERKSREYFDDVQRREEQRAERERLRKLFEGNSRDDASDG